MELELVDSEWEGPITLFILGDSSSAIYGICSQKYHNTKAFILREEGVDTFKFKPGGLPGISCHTSGTAGMAWEVKDGTRTGISDLEDRR